MNVGDDFDRMEDIARQIPLSRIQRPAWDIEKLSDIGLSVKTDVNIWERVWSHQEKTNFASTPLFMICGYKGDQVHP